MALKLLSSAREKRIPAKKSPASRCDLCWTIRPALVVCIFVCWSALLTSQHESITQDRRLLSVNQDSALQDVPAPLNPPQYKYSSPFIHTYEVADLKSLNTNRTEGKRSRQAKGTTVKHYLHQDMPNYNYPQLVLRTMIMESIFVGPLREPTMARSGERENTGCPENSTQCMLTWDGWARAMSAGDVLYDILQRDIPGHVVEVGVFKGGISAYFQALLIASGETNNRQVWLVDSFQGLPPASLMKSAVDDSQSAYNSDRDQKHWAGKLSVGLATVRRNMDRLGLLIPTTKDENTNLSRIENETSVGNVHFLEGFVQDTLPNWPDDREISLLRVDVDIYSATYDTLHYLYPRLVRGGAVLFDDWKFPYSRAAVKTYRKKHNITTPVQFLDGCFDPMAYWIKE